jgi:type I restriction enzyme, R subunit
MTPEEKSREEIDAQLAASGWVIQTKDRINLAASRGVAICELSFAGGHPDYTLFVEGKAIGTTEAKPAGHSLVGVEEQSYKYVTGVPFGLPAWQVPLPFCYESTGSETAFTNRLDPDPRSRIVFAFRLRHRSLRVVVERLWVRTSPVKCHSMAINIGPLSFLAVAEQLAPVV